MVTTSTAGSEAWWEEARGNSDLCPRRLLGWETRSNGAGLPLPQASKMMGTRISGLAFEFKLQPLLSVTLTRPFLSFQGGLRVGKQLAHGHTARRGWDVRALSWCPSWHRPPSLMPTKPKGLNHRSPPGQPGDMTRRRIQRVSRSKLQYWLGQVPPHACPVHTRAHTHAHTHTRCGRGKNQV